MATTASGSSYAHMAYQDSHLFPSSLNFNVVVEKLPLQQDGTTTKEKITAIVSKGRIFICNGRKILSLDPKTGMVAELTEFSTDVYFTSVHPRTGALVVRVKTQPHQSFIVVNADNGSTSQVVIDGTEIPSAVFFTMADEKVFKYGKYLVRETLDGVLVKSPRLPRTAGKPEFTADGAYFSTEACILFWPFEGDFVELAGRTSAPGNQDGIGWQARFTGLRAVAPIVGRFLFVRDCPNGPEKPSRLIRLDIPTYEVKTMHVEGFDLVSKLVYMLPHEEFLYVIIFGDTEGEYKLLRASVYGESGSTLSNDIKTMDMEQELKPFIFRLPNKTLSFDYRLLAARSSYFRAMFDSGCREASEGVVDLRNDPDVGAADLQDVLRFIISDAFSPIEDSTDHVLNVRQLADRYQLSRLTALTEAWLAKSLSKDNVLQMLSRVYGSGRSLERYCWELLEECGCEILQDCDLSLLIQTNPQLTKALILRSKGFSSSQPSEPPSKRQRKE